MSDASLLQAVKNLYSSKDDYVKAMEASPQKDSISMIVDVIREAAGV